LLRHFIPKHLTYDHEKDSSKNNADHFGKFKESFKKDPIVIYVHGQDRDR
jgi:hypothetical protein